MVDKYYYCRSRRDQMTSDQYKSNTNHHPVAASFSSTLLDEIYRSIDIQGGDENMRRKKQSSIKEVNFHGACMMEKKVRSTAAEMGGFRPKPIRVCSDSGATTKNDGFIKNLKKVKQPISPGARLAAFLNSLFTKRSINNNISPSSSPPPSNSSRSCLSKTPSSRAKSSASEKRTVEDFQIKKHAIDQDQINNRRVVVLVEEEETARDLILNNYQKKDFHHLLDQDFDDDAASCASSDLFELDNLSAIGMERYREELPVYETTHLHTNRAIASGLIL